MAVLGNLRHGIIGLLAICSTVVFSKDLSGGVPIPVRRRLEANGAFCTQHSGCDSLYCHPTDGVCADAPIPDDLAFTLDVGDEAVGLEWVYGTNYLDAVNRLIIFLYETDESGNLLTNEQGLSFDDYSPGFGVLDVFSTDTFVNNLNNRMSNSQDYAIVFRQEGYNGQVKEQQTISFRPFATDCVYGPWGDWGECSSICLNEVLGVRTRFRDVAVPESEPNGSCEVLLQTDEEACNRISCPNGETCDAPFTTSLLESGGIEISYPGNDTDCISDFCNVNSVCDDPVYPEPVSNVTTTLDGNGLTYSWLYGSDVATIEQVRVVLLDVRTGATLKGDYFASSITSDVFFINFDIPYQIAFYTLNEDGESAEARSSLVLRSGEDCVYSEWSAWSECTEACGGGSRSRTRSIVQDASNTEGVVVCDPNSLNEEDLSCNSHTCPVDCVMSEWVPEGECSEVLCGVCQSHGACVDVCDNAVQAYTRSEISGPEFGGEECGAIYKEEPCDSSVCAECPDVYLVYYKTSWTDAYIAYDLGLEDQGYSQAEVQMSVSTSTVYPGAEGWFVVALNADQLTFHVYNADNVEETSDFYSVTGGGELFIEGEVHAYSPAHSFFVL